jgi:hypothetical protein
LPTLKLLATDTNKFLQHYNIYSYYFQYSSKSQETVILLHNQISRQHFTPNIWGYNSLALTPSYFSACSSAITVGSAKEKKKHPATVVVVVGVFLFWSARLGWSVGFCVVWCVGVCPFGVALALSLSFWGFLGSFVCGSINLSTFLFLPVLGLVLWLVWFGRSRGWWKRKKTIKKRLAVGGLPSLFSCYSSSVSSMSSKDIPNSSNLLESPLYNKIISNKG